MKITSIASSTVIIEHAGIKVITDPWIVDGEYYGSWYQYPEVHLPPSVISEIDFIYISHIHPDHFSRKSLPLFPKTIPVLINEFPQKFLKFNIERLGFKVIEIKNGEKYNLGADFEIEIRSADNCDPVLCNSFFGCDTTTKEYKVTQIDSLAVFSTSDYVLVNTNDCPFALAQYPLQEIRNTYSKIDFLLVGYAGAGPFPQCFNLEKHTLEESKKSKERTFINQAVKYIEYLEPEYFMPFAGTYTLGGSLYCLNEDRGVPSINNALLKIQANVNGSRGLLLNRNESFSLTNPIIPIYRAPSESDYKQFLSRIAKIPYDYEGHEPPSFEELEGLINSAFSRYKSELKRLEFVSETILFIDLTDDKLLEISFTSNPSYRIVDIDDYLQALKSVRISLDIRLLRLILMGPRFAHWNNAEVGSHLSFVRKPIGNYERMLYYSLSHFHV